MKDRAGVFLIFFIPGLCSLISGFSPQYHFVSNRKNWTEAQKYCREKFSDLASIYNREEIVSLTEAVHTDFAGKAWIGLERGVMFKWHWSLADRYFYRDRELEFQNWKEGEPKNDGGEERCAAMNPSGKWFNDNCNSKRPFICLKGKSNDKKGFVLLKQKKTWRQAQIFCRKNHRDLSWVAKKAENASTAHVWLGLRFTCMFKFWFWIKSEPGCYQNWAQGHEPSGLGECGHTGAIQSGGEHQWVSLPETEKLNFICYTCGGEFWKMMLF
ncbi:hypothetical protein AAFF_G00250150 [Aldrovandia affinis]|uniref:C-type lectin domain-containing protein n=1 Tax=Aldrovandia affinis TaxID=143900 RepID=A0AAD7RCZ0_9TELE|nr:hypothetical protein AAFF_G00250150 [Aldrovandia affinis]